MKLNSRPLVSVITIFLNEEKFIQDAIESVLAQTYDNWELLLVDDGSIDGSTAIAQQFADENPGKVRFLDHDNHQNQGMSASRNLGIRHASGKYIAFLDADDVWFSHTLERRVSILEARPEAGMVYGSTQYWYSWTGKAEDIDCDYFDSDGRQSPEVNTLFSPPALLTYFLGDTGYVPCICSVLVHRKIIEDVGGFEESFRSMYEDQVFYVKVGLKTPVLVVNECWSKYRQHPNSCCNLADKKEINHANLLFLDWLTRYLYNQAVTDIRVWRALGKALWPYRYPSLNRLLKRSKLIWLMKRVWRWALPAPIYQWLLSQWQKQ